jgi:hypothetical protein
MQKLNRQRLNDSGPVESRVKPPVETHNFVRTRVRQLQGDVGHQGRVLVV